jgi:PHP family Zn ribbon phosphoesterase
MKIKKKFCFNKLTFVNFLFLQLHQIVIDKNRKSIIVNLHVDFKLGWYGKNTC